MANNGTITFNITAGGVSIGDGLVTRSGESVIGVHTALPAGEAGILTTKTNDTDGTITSVGHSIESADKIDIYWTGGVAYGATVGEVGADTIPFTGAGGDALPAQDTAVIVTERVVINEPFSGDALMMIGASCGQRAHIDFTSSVPASLHAVELKTVNEAWAWWKDSAFTNPLAGDTVATIQASNGSLTAATLKIPGIRDSVA